ncbi:hypothetical protein U1Q18_015409 [Sarracenia purpurea var. burkii]
MDADLYRDPLKTGGDPRHSFKRHTRSVLWRSLSTGRDICRGRNGGTFFTLGRRHVRRRQTTKTSGDVLEPGLVRSDVFGERFGLRNSGFSGGVRDNLILRIPPLRFPHQAFVLDQDVRSPSFVRWHLRLLIFLRLI